MVPATVPSATVDWRPGPLDFGETEQRPTLWPCKQAPSTRRGSSRSNMGDLSEITAVLSRLPPRQHLRPYWAGYRQKETVLKIQRSLHAHACPCSLCEPRLELLCFLRLQSGQPPRVPRHSPAETTRHGRKDVAVLLGRSRVEFGGRSSKRRSEGIMGEVVYVSKSRIERKRGPLRIAHLPGEPQPVVFSVHGAIAEHYKVDPANLKESHASTIDYVIAATAG